MTISEICQIFTASAASASFICNIGLTLKKSKRQFAVNVSVWSEDSELFIRNGNNTALYNVFVFTDLNTVTCSLAKHLDRVNEFNTYWDYHETFPVMKTMSHKFDSDPAAGGHHLVPSVLFTDTAGKYWYRKANGRLVNLDFDYTELLLKRGFVLNHLRA